MSKTALVFKHVQLEGSCLFGATLEELDFEVKSVRTPSTDLSLIDPLEPDLLMVMGGPIGVYQADDYPFLHTEIEYMRRRVAADKPVLGICLGAQMLARALGADVYPGGKGGELGWGPLTLEEAAKDHPARHLCASKTNMFHWHNDTFDLPDGATLLARTDQYANQIFSYGRSLGIQCHAEVRSRQLQEWFVMLVGQLTGPGAVIGLRDLRRQTEENLPVLNRQARLFFEEWLESVGL